MEKNYNCLFNLKSQDLIWRIVEGTRRAARAIPELRNSKNGCLRITIVPLSQLAEAWLGGGLSDFGEFPDTNVHDVCEREYIYKLNPEGSHTIQFICEDGHTEPVNCYDYSALKVAYASWKRQFDKWVQDNDIPETLEAQEFSKKLQYCVAENGYSADGGVVYTTVSLDGEDFMRLYVTVSGAQSGADDERCAFAGMLDAQSYFATIMDNIAMSKEVTLEFRLTPDFVPMDET